MQTNTLQKTVSQGLKKARQQTGNDRRRTVQQTVRGGGSKAVYTALNTAQKAQFARELEDYYRKSQQKSGDLAKQTAARKSNICSSSSIHYTGEHAFGGSSGSFGEALGYGKAIGGGIEAGLWNGAVRGPLDLGASKIAQEISSDDTDTWLGKSSFQKERGINAAFLGRLGDIWGGYEAGDGTFGQNLKDTAFAGYNSAFQNLLEGAGRIPAFPGGESREAMYLGSNALFHAIKEYALPAITGSRDKDYNARWLTENAYEASDRLTEKVSSIPGLKYVDAEKYQKDLAASSPSVRLAGNVSSVVANMLPAIGISAATGSPDAALVALSSAAAGNAAKEAYESGATPEQAYYIGLEKGYVEYLTEGMFDALGAFGGGALTPGIKSLLGEYAATKGGRALIKAGGILGENIEEGVSDWAGSGIERAVLGHTIGGESDKTLAQALAGQAPWTEEGFVTLLSTLALNGGGQIINSVTTSQEKAASSAQQANEAAYLRRMEEIGYLPPESSKNAAREGAAAEKSLFQQVKDKLSHVVGKERAKVIRAMSFGEQVAGIENGLISRQEKPFANVRDTTPAELIQKAGAEQLPIIMSYESAYLSARSEGTQPGHYHKLGAELMDQIPAAMELPLVLIRQNNGRIAEILDLKDQNGRNVFLSIELSAVKDVDGKNKAYNLIITAFGAEDNYIGRVLKKEGNSVLENKLSEDDSQVNPRRNKLPGTINE